MSVKGGIHIGYRGEQSIKPIQLPERLATLADAVEPGARVADIGTDHALLPIHLVQSRRVAFAIASDVTEGPYTTALQNVESMGLTEEVSVRLGDGLHALTPGETDTVVVAGMGGSTARSILEQGTAVLEQVQRIIVQPMNAAWSVRQFLRNAGFGLLQEGVVAEGSKLYQWLCADRRVPADTHYDRYHNAFTLRLAYEYGPLTLENPSKAAIQLIHEEVLRLQSALQSLTRSEHEDVKRRRDEYKAKYDFLTVWLTSNREQL